MKDQWTAEEHEVQLRQAAQATNAHLWNRKRREAAELANRECAHQMEDWKARVEAAGFQPNPAVPQSPPPKGVSSTRVLPNVHEAPRHGNPLVPMPAAPAAAPAVDPMKVGAPIPKGPPASCVPTPRDVLAPQPMDSCAADALPGQAIQMAYGQMPKILYVKSPTNIDWNSPLKDQLEPQLTGGPDPKKTFEELCFLRSRIPKLDDDGFKKIFPGTEHCILCVAQKTGARHFIHLSVTQ